MSTDERPRIIVDDDWKSRVQAEKQQLQKGAPEQPVAPEKSAGSSRREAERQLPPASFQSLVSMLVTQSLAALGQIPLGAEQKPVVMLAEAKHIIDLLAVLEEKTKGNLSPEEAAVLTNVLHELRMIFVAAKSRA